MLSKHVIKVSSSKFPQASMSRLKVSGLFDSCQSCQAQQLQKLLTDQFGIGEGCRKNRVKSLVFYQTRGGTAKNGKKPYLYHTGIDMV